MDDIEPPPPLVPIEHANVLDWCNPILLADLAIVETHVRASHDESKDFHQAFMKFGDDVRAGLYHDEHGLKFPKLQLSLALGRLVTLVKCTVLATVFEGLQIATEDGKYDD